MNPFQVFRFPLEADEVLEWEADIPTLFSGHSPDGERYLVRHAARSDHTVIWVCAPISERALACVRTGRAEVRDAFTHTATGGVDILTLGPDGHCTESFKMCAELRDEDLPPAGSHLGLVRLSA
jgi:hypothetical protein